MREGRGARGRRKGIAADYFCNLNLLIYMDY